MNKAPQRPEPRVYGRALVWSIALIVAFVAPTPAQIPHQVTGPTGSVGPPAPGPGVLRGKVIPARAEDSVNRLPIVLYALQPDGTPGLANTDSDESGSFVFTNLSTEPGVVYLLGTRAGEVPFGRRVIFSPGQTELDTEIQLQAIRADASELRVSESLWLIDWIGTQLLVQVAQKITNPSDYVVYVNASDRDGRLPPHQVRLPDNVAEFLGASEDLSVSPQEAESGLISWGPFYPGDQELRYGFLVEAGEEGEAVTVEEILPLGTDRLSVGIPNGSSALEAGDWVDSGETVTSGGVVYQRFDFGKIEAGGQRQIALRPPPSSQDASALHVVLTNYWVDHDDTEIRVNAQVQLDVDSESRLRAAAGESLLHIDLPTGAEFQALTPGSELLGVVPSDQGGLDIRGPLPPGPSSIGYTYRLPVLEGSTLDLRVSKEVETLNVLVADNGVVIESNRLHRQKPFKQGTRFYLHRQAYQVAPDETVHVKLIPISHSGISTDTARLAALAGGVLAVLFLIAPLRSKKIEAHRDDSSDALSREREGLYESIRDLEDDLETGKLDPADYEKLRAELRESAVNLLREQLALEKTPNSPNEEAKPAAFCIECGGPLEADWKFCSGCGAVVSNREPPK